MSIPFDSQRSYYRTPFGAVEQDTTVHFRALPPRADHSKTVELCVKYDYDYNWEYHKMLWCGNFDENTEIWECDFTPHRMGLYWYCFRMNTANGKRYIIPSDPYRVSEVAEHPGRSWQLTCYKKGFATPRWPVGGVMYQIFPDRFCFSGEEKKLSRTDFQRNTDWYALPV